MISLIKNFKDPTFFIFDDFSKWSEQQALWNFEKSSNMEIVWAEKSLKVFKNSY